MKLTINGESREFREGVNIPEVLKSLGLEGKPVVVELNRDALSPSEFETPSLKEGDLLEIISIAAGG